MPALVTAATIGFVAGPCKNHAPDSQYERPMDESEHHRRVNWATHFPHVSFCARHDRANALMHFDVPAQRFSTENALYRRLIEVIERHHKPA